MKTRTNLPVTEATEAVHASQVMTAFTLTVPDEVCRQLRLAIIQAHDEGESWKSLEARTLVSDTNLIKITKKKRPIGPMVAVRLAQALGFELQMKCVKRKRKAA